MKYLKSINEFNESEYSNKETDSLVQTIKDICIELEDEGFSINVSKMLPNSDKIFVRIKWKKYKKRPDSSNLKDVTSRVRDLMEISGWFEKDPEDNSYEDMTFTRDKEKEYVTFGDGVAHTNF